MAVAKLVCGDCGSEISPRDAFCPTCGARIEKGEVTAPAEIICPACGHRNPGRSEICESCGAGLPGTSERPKGGARPEKKPQKKREPGSARQEGRRYEPWQVVSGIAVLAFVGYLVYVQITEKNPSSVAISSPLPGTTLNAPLLTPNKGKVDLTPLEQAVKANPNDPTAILRLANALQDNGVFPRAIEAYKKYLAMRPKDADARTDLGMTYFQYAQIDTAKGMMLFQQAASEMEAAFASSPRHQTSAFNLGVVNLHMGNLEESNKWFMKAVEIDKNSDLGIRAQKILTQHTLQQ